MQISEDTLTVSSRQYQRYEFDARASAPYTLDDPIVTVAMHVNVSVGEEGGGLKGQATFNCAAILSSFRIVAVIILWAGVHKQLWITLYRFL